MRRSISGELEERARDARRVALAREASRRTIGEFVDGWLLARNDGESSVFDAVKVYFLDEMDETLRGQLREPRPLDRN